MKQSDFLKIAYLYGISKAAGESNLDEKDVGVLVKYALGGGIWQKAKGLFRRGSKEVAPVAERGTAAAGEVAATGGRGITRSEGYMRDMRGAPQATTTGAPQMSTRREGYMSDMRGPRGVPSTAEVAAKKTAPAAQAPAAAPQMPTKPGFRAPEKVPGESFLSRRARTRTARKTYKMQAATPKLVAKQEARTSREIVKSQGQAQKENVQRQSQAALAREQQALQAAQAEQKAAVGAKKMPSRKAAPASEAAPAPAPTSGENVKKVTETTKDTAKSKADEASAAATGSTAKGEAEAAKGSQTAEETGAKAEENMAERLEKTRGSLTPGQLAEAEQAGATGGLGFMPTTLAPAAIGAGVGYAADGREGALMGAGLGLGARAGMSPILKRMRSAKGMLGSSAAKGAVPTMSEYMATPLGRKALWGTGIAGAGGAGLGYAAGSQLPEQEPEPWYSGLGMGLTPEMMQGVGRTALPMLAQQYGLEPPQMQQQMPGYY